MKRTQEDWISLLQELGCLWEHDLDLRRPFALLTGGRISQHYTNGARLTQWPEHLADAVSDLIPCIPPVHWNPKNVVVIGPAKGAITLAHEIGRQKSWRSWFAEKTRGGKLKVDERFHPSGNEYFVICDDVITSAETCRRVAAALKDIGFSRRSIAPFFVCLVNQSGGDVVQRVETISLVQRPITTWERGENPFTQDGEEYVEPVRPKEYWGELTAKLR